MALFQYMNSRPDWNIEAKFGTFSQYFNALADRAENSAEADFPVLSGDFFPYNDYIQDYWTGYYTTRPFWKRLDRLVQAHIRAADIFSALAFSKAQNLVSENSKERMVEILREGRRDVALFQHHDAITGTSKWPVARDYGMRLYKAFLGAGDVISASTQLLLLDEKMNIQNGNILSDSLQWSLVERSPTSFQCVRDQNTNRKEGNKNCCDEFPATLENRSSETARDCNNTDSNHNPALDDDGSSKKGLFELLFMAEVAPISLSTFILKWEDEQPPSTVIARVSVGHQQDSSLAALPALYWANCICRLLCAPLPEMFPDFFSVFKAQSITGDSIELQNDYLRTWHKKETGLLEGVTYGNETSRKMKLQFYHYENTNSGAYLFKPGSDAKKWDIISSNVFHIKGPLSSEVHSFLPRIYHKFAIVNAKGVAGKELYIYNTVDLRNVKNTELTMRLETDVRTQDESFHTDHMGLQERLTVLCGHGHGGTRPEEGTLEIMLDRILTMDDQKGLGGDSLIRDNLPGRSEFRILMEHKKNGKVAEETKAEKTNGEKKERTSLYHSLSAFDSLQKLLYPAIINREVPPRNRVHGCRPDMTFVVSYFVEEIKT